MSTPTILGYETVASGGNLTIPALTKVIVGVFFANPSATIGGVSPTGSANYSSNISIKVWDKTAGIGTKALAGGSTGCFEYLDNADPTYLEIYAGYSGSGQIIKSLTSSATSLVVGGVMGSSGVSGNIYFKEGANAFNYRYNSGSCKVGERVASGATMSIAFQDDGVSAVVYGCAVSIPYKFYSSGVSTVYLSDYGFM